MMNMDATIDHYFETAGKWKEELKQLRKIAVEEGLTETLKWGAPCYTFRGNNVAIIGGFKDHCVFSFFKGALLKDRDGILQKPGEQTQSARIIRFTSVAGVVQMKSILTAYIHEAMEVEKAGLKVNFKKHHEPSLPELKKELAADPAFRSAFEALTPGRQRAYLLYFSAPKQSKTRASRIEKYKQHILEGKGMNDR